MSRCLDVCPFRPFDPLTGLIVSLCNKIRIPHSNITRIPITPCAFGGTKQRILQDMHLIGEYGFFHNFNLYTYLTVVVR